MNTLYLVRHSKAQQQHPGGDKFRALTAEGEARIASLLPLAAERGFRAELALSSPYVRAVETRDRFAPVIGSSRLEVSGAFAPGADPRTPASSWRPGPSNTRPSRCSRTIRWSACSRT